MYAFFTIVVTFVYISLGVSIHSGNDMIAYTMIVLMWILNIINIGNMASGRK